MPYDELKECLRRMEQLQACYPDKDFSAIPGSEGLIDRVISSYGNLFKWWRNLFHDVRVMAAYRSDWGEFCRQHMHDLLADPMSDENFRTLNAFCMPKAIIDRHINALKQAVNCYKHLADLVLSNDKAEIPSALLGTIRALEACDCTINFEKPEKSDCASRSKYIKLMRIHNQGYGNNHTEFLKNLEEALDELVLFQKTLSSDAIGTREIKKIEDQVQKIKKPNINPHAKKRTMVLGATLVAANALLKLTIECGIASPLSVLATHRGFKDDVMSGIFGKKKDEDKK